MSEPKKHDMGKTDMNYIPSLAMEEVAQVMSFGAKKYGDYNWAEGTGIQWSRYFNACLRHLWEYWRGKDFDDETGKSHLAHAGACILILLEYALLKKGLDDRPGYYSRSNNQEQK